jgi:hypothetical protein
MRMSRTAPFALLAFVPLVALVRPPQAAPHTPQAAPKIPPANAPQIASPETSQRGNTRIFYWGGDHSAGQLAVDYGKPVWKDSYDAAVDQQLGKRWRLGQNFWTSLDTNMELTAGKAELAPGQYYLVLERKGDGQFVLIVLDPVEMRDRHLDAFQAPQTTGGTEIPLDYRKVDVPADHLAIRLELDGKIERGARLVIQFGKHELTGHLLMKPNL